MSMSHQLAGRQQRVVVVGAGPAGLMAAIAAAEQGAHVLVLEHMPRPGLKLLATGGGHCNLTHACDAQDLMTAFGRQGRFMAPALAALDPVGLRRFFRERGVETVVEPDGCVFPVVRKAATVLQALMDTLAARRVDIVTHCRVTRLALQADRIAGVHTADDTLAADTVILALGGRGYPGLGGTGDGCALAAQAGHKVRPQLCALVPLRIRETWVHRLAGITLPDAQVRLRGVKGDHATRRGALLFTHHGLSGPAVLDLSGAVSEQLKRTDGVTELELRVEAASDAAAWLARLAAWRESQGQRKVERCLCAHMSAALAGALCQCADLAPDRIVAQLTRIESESLARILAGAPVTVTGNEGFEHAMVTRGGVTLAEVDPDTLESRRVRGLKFAGELLDLDGPCGGYNLQWAFSSGRLAGQTLRQC